MQRILQVWGKGRLGKPVTCNIQGRFQDTILQGVQAEHRELANYPVRTCPSQVLPDMTRNEHPAAHLSNQVFLDPDKTLSEMPLNKMRQAVQIGNDLQQGKTRQIDGIDGLLLGIAAEQQVELYSCDTLGGSEYFREYRGGIKSRNLRFND